MKEHLVKETDWLKGEIESLSHTDSIIIECGAKYYLYQINLMEILGDNTAE